VKIIQLSRFLICRCKINFQLILLRFNYFKYNIEQRIVIEKAI